MLLITIDVLVSTAPDEQGVCVLQVWMPTFKVERGSLTQREKENVLEIRRKTNGTVVDGGEALLSSSCCIGIVN